MPEQQIEQLVVEAKKLGIRLEDLQRSVAKLGSAEKKRRPERGGRGKP